MSQPNEICQFCGGEIVFRSIRGKIVLLHTGNEDCEGRNFYRREQEGIAHPTKCPRCGSPVIFLRNNGGCVWLDSIGWPWPKHPCFDSENLKPPAFLESSHSLKDGRLRFVNYLGLLKSDEGFAVVLVDSKELLRKNPRYRYQWEVVCARELAEKTGPELHGKCVIASYEEKRLITLAGEVFTMREHTARYHSKFSHDPTYGKPS
jgi:ssDNA-binding Zn-finger/Zn-ribbon topoisomerase 1